MLVDIAAWLGVPLAYLCAVTGSLGVEFAAAMTAAGNAGGKFPERYKRPPYLAARVIFAFVFAGSLPFILEAATAAAAFYIGACAPVVYDKLARGIASPDS